MNGTDKYIKTVEYLSELYDYCNKALFRGELNKPVITIQCATRNNNYGWWTGEKVWQQNNTTYEYHELNITAQFLNREDYEIASTLIHEMCHQYAQIHGIQDTSRSGTYHNCHFKKIAEDHGLNVEKIPKTGWAKTVIHSETYKLLLPFLDHKENTPIIFRTENTPDKKPHKSSTRTYICPHCRQTIRATKDVNIMCLDCHETMIKK